MFAKLTLNQASRQARPGLRPAPMLRVAPAHANDNRAPRHAGGAGRPVLTCRWVASASGGLECRWSVVGGEATWPDGSGEAVRMRRPVAAGGQLLALVAGRAHRVP
jgi:hypothetical protein